MSTQTRTRPAPAAGGQRAARPVVPVAVAAALVVAVLVRLHTRSELWLDEALSVNIATLPLADLPAALRQDGAPPLYYLLLHGWTAVFGTSDVAVRALSQLVGLASLPLAWLAGARLHSRPAGWASVLLLGSSPFAVRYADETRMYALVLLLVLAGALLLHDALRDPRPLRLAALSVVAAALALTHYWALFLLAVVGAGLLAGALVGPAPRACRRCVAGLLAGGLLFLPWLPVFLFQSANTGTPWARPPQWTALVRTFEGWSGPGLPGALLGLALLALVLAAPLLHPGPDGGLVLGAPVSRTALALSATALGTLALGVAVTKLQASGYALRYSAVVVVPALLAAAVALQALRPRPRALVLCALVALGTATTVTVPFDDTRTQAGLTAAALRARLAPGDLVVYCPDQLGPAVDRLLPAGTDQLVFPSGGRPERIDWVDYAARNASADPVGFADAASQRARGAVWLVLAEGYRTYGDSCERLDAALAAERPGRERVLDAQYRYVEQQALVRYPARPGVPG